MNITHPIPPEYNKNSKVLILGSFPSVKSRESGFYYGHKQNRFWKVLAAVFGCAVPETVEQKKAFLHAHNIALWDVISSCDITGSADSSIKNVVPNDISSLLRECSIEQIFTNGKTAHNYYNKYILNSVGRSAVCLPSTSPANAAFNLNKLILQWQAVKLSD